MTSKNKENESAKQAQKRLAEIAEILLNGVRRLEAKESAQNFHLLVDSKHQRSLHGVDSNPNQQLQP